MYRLDIFGHNVYVYIYIYIFIYIYIPIHTYPQAQAWVTMTYINQRAAPTHPMLKFGVRGLWETTFDSACFSTNWPAPPSRTLYSYRR